MKQLYLDYQNIMEYRLKTDIMGVVTFLLAITAVVHAHSNTVNGFTKNPECGKSVGCYSDCDSGNCGYEMTYVKMGDKIEITLKKSLTSLSSANKYWIAIGFSNDQKMGDDSVTECIDEGNAGVDVYNSYNNNQYRGNSRLTTNVKLGIEKVSGSNANGVLSCKFTRKIISTASNVFSLNQAYYILLAYGIDQNGSKRKHTTNPLVSPSKIDMQAVSDVSGEAAIPLIKAHGSLMVAAWICCASIAIVLARFYKPVWADRQIIGEKVWFQFHRCIMVVAVMAEFVGFALIFVHAQTWLTFEGASNFKKTHPYLGVIVTALALINPIMALFRPHPGDKYRIIFNWAHWGVGTVAHILGVLTIIVGVTLGKSQTHDYTLYVVVAYAIYQFLFELIMEIHSCCADRSKAKGEAYEMKETDKFGQEKKKDESHTFKKFMLVLHVIVILGFSVAIIVMINIGNKSIM